MTKILLILSFFIFNNIPSTTTTTDNSVITSDTELKALIPTADLYEVDLNENIKSNDEEFSIFGLTCYTWSGCGSSGTAGLSSSTYEYISSQCDANGGSISECDER